MNTIKKNREEIDKIDKKIVKYLDKRMQYAYEIGKLKGKNKSEIIVNEREKEIYQSLENIQTQFLTETEKRHLLKEIIKIGRSHGELGKKEYEQNK